MNVRLRGTKATVYNMENNRKNKPSGATLHHIMPCKLSLTATIPGFCFVVLDQCLCSDLRYLTGDKNRSVYRSTRHITITMCHHLSIVIILYRGTLAVPPPY